MASLPTSVSSDSLRAGSKGVQKETTHALILDRHKVNNDVIIHALTEHHGRLSAAARHARRAKKRFRGHLESLTLVEVTFRQRPDWDLARLDDARVIHAFPILKGDLLRVAMASVMAEIVLGFTQQGLVEPELFHLTHKAYKTLDDPSRTMDESLLVLFELRTLLLSGFLPSLEDVFGPENPATKHCYQWLNGTWQPMNRELAQRSAIRLERLIEEHLGRPLRSRALLDEALGWER